MRVDVADKLLQDLKNNLQKLKQIIDIIDFNNSSIEYVRKTIHRGVSLELCQSISPEEYKNYKSSLRDYENILTTTWKTKNLETADRLIREFIRVRSSIQFGLKGIISRFSKKISTEMTGDLDLGSLIFLIIAVAGGALVSVVPLSFIVVVKILVLVGNLEISAAIHVFLLIVLLITGVSILYAFRNFVYTRKLKRLLEILENSVNYLNNNWKENTTL
jgi:hypothetical protein